MTLVIEAPIVSILLPVRNGERYLRETLASVEAQSETRWLLLAVLDNSTDGSRMILERFNPDKTHILESRGAGVAAALNTGVEAAPTEFIARLDADDVMSPDRLAMQLRHFSRDPSLDVSHSSATIVDSRGDVIGTRKVVVDVAINRRLLLRNCIIHPTVMYRKSLIARSGGYNTTLTRLEDYELWLRLAANGARIAGLEDELLCYRVHEGQHSIAGPVYSAPEVKTLAEARYQLAATENMSRVSAKWRHTAWRIWNARLSRMLRSAKL